MIKSGFCVRIQVILQETMVRNLRKCWIVLMRACPVKMRDGIKVEFKLGRHKYIRTCARIYARRIYITKQL